MESGELLAFEFGFLLSEDFRVEGFLVFEQMPEGGRACSPLRAVVLEKMFTPSLRRRARSDAPYLGFPTPV